jgi:hypothetical protein
MKALIHNGVVVDVSEQEFEVHEEFIWVDAPGDITAGCVYQDGVFTRVTFSARTYAERRRKEYPPIADYLDGVVKGDQAQINAYIAACQAVKAKYPKPESV